MQSLNPLFNKKAIKELVNDVQISDKQKESSKKWLDLLDKNKLENEKSNYPKFMSIVLDNILGYPIEEIDFEKNNVEFSFSNKDRKKILCFEVKGTITKDLHAIQHRSKKEHSTPIKQTWDYMGSMGLDYGICTNYKEFILITKEYGYSKEYNFDFTTIKNNESKLKEFIGIFSKERIIESGFIKKLHTQSQNVEKEFTKEFYKLYHETRLMLKMSFEENQKVSSNEAIYYTQLFLNRLIFIFFVEDRGFISDSKLFRKRILNILDQGQLTEHSKKIYDDIKELFISFDKGSDILGVFGFNGGLFNGIMPEKILFPDLKDDTFFNDVKQNSKLLKSTKLNDNEEIIIKKHNSLNPIISNLLIMDSFDFNTEVNVNILGHIFEQSISDLEELKKSGISSRKKEGVYYTPEYITDFICRNTIIPHLSKNGTNDISKLIDEYKNDIETLEKKFNEIKILDPACGSGAFLIKAIDILLEINREIQNKKNTKYTIEQKQITHDFDEESQIRFIVENNIYGVDLNPESIEITQLSIFLKIASNTRKLIGLSKNIQNGNSLISNKEIDVKAFVWADKFPEILSHLIKDNGFDIIIGNPPYVRQETLNNKESMILPKNHTLKLPENFIIDSKSDLSCYFHYHALNLLKDGGILGFISSDSWLHFDYGKNIRKLFLDNCDILEITKTNFNVFEDADISTAIILLKKSQTKDHNALFKTVNKGGFESNNFTKTEKSQNKLNTDNWNNNFSDFKLMPKIDMVKMEDVGIIKRGKTTGCNDFFILTKDVIEKYGIAEQYVYPCVSRNITSIDLNDVNPDEYLLNVNETKGQLTKTKDGKKILEYIEKMGSKKIIPKKGSLSKECKIKDLETISNRKIWYSLGLDKSQLPLIILARFAHGRMKIYENNGNYFSRDNCVWFIPHSEKFVKPILAYLSSSYFTLLSEICGHSQSGKSGSALQLLTGDWKKIYLPDLTKIDKICEILTDTWNTYKNDLDLEKLDDTVISILFQSNNLKHIQKIKQTIRLEIMNKINQRGRLNAYIKEIKNLNIEFIPE